MKLEGKELYEFMVSIKGQERRQVLANLLTACNEPGADPYKVIVELWEEAQKQQPAVLDTPVYTSTEHALWEATELAINRLQGRRD